MGIDRESEVRDVILPPGGDRTREPDASDGTEEHFYELQKGPPYRSRAVYTLAATLAALGGLLLLGVGNAKHRAELRRGLPVDYPTASCSYAEQPECPVADLLQRPDVHEAVVDNVMRVGSKLIQPDDRNVVLASVVKTFTGIMEDLEERAPDVAARLHKMTISEEQKDSVVLSLKRMSDPRVQSLGVDATRAIKDCPSSSPENVRRCIERRLRPRRKEVLELRRELLPEYIRHMWGGDLPWLFTLDRENLAVMQTTRGGNLAPIRPEQGSIFVEDVQLQPAAEDVMAASLESGRVVLGLVAILSRFFGQSVEAPDWVTTLRRVSTMKYNSYVSDLMTCEMESHQEVAINFMKALYCPLKYGTQGLDVLAAARSIAAEEKPRRQPAERNQTEESSVQVYPSCEYMGGMKCPASELFLLPEIHEAATETIMQVGKNLLLPVERPSVLSGVATGLVNLSVQLQRRAPEVASEFYSVHLGAEQKDAIVAALRLLSDMRLQQLGLEVAGALRDTPSLEIEDMRHHIEERLRPRIEEIRKLREELVPPVLRSVWDHQRPWSMTLDPENVRVMKKAHGGHLVPVNVTMETFFLHDLVLHVAPEDVLGAVLEQGRALLLMLTMCARLVGKDLSLPEWAASLSIVDEIEGIAADASDIMSCELDTHKRHTINFMKAIFCPLKYATQGLDALAAGGAFASGGGGAGGEHREMPPRPACSYNEAEECPASELLLSHEVHLAAGKNVMEVGSNLLGRGDQEVVMAAVQMGFTNLSTQLRARAPEALTALQQLLLTETHKNALVACLRLLTDQRVQAIGLQVGRAIREGKSVHPDHVRLRVEASLRKNLSDVRALRDELVPLALREVWGTSEAWPLTLDPENIRVMRNSYGGELCPLNTTMQHLYLFDMEVHASWKDVMAGVLEEGRTLIQLIRLAALSASQDLTVPTWITSLSLVDTMELNSFHSDLMSCELNIEIDTTVNFMKALFCPLKYGAMGLDALAAAGPFPVDEVVTEDVHQLPGKKVCAFDKSSGCPAKDLLTSPTIVKTVTESLMQVGHNLLQPSDFDRVGEAVNTGFEDISTLLRLRAPEVYHVLGAVPLGRAQTDAVVACIHLMHDPRIQTIGREVAVAMRSTMTTEVSALLRSIVEKLEPQLYEIKAMRDELVPRLLAEVWGTREQWALTLDPENIRVMQAASGGVLAPVHVTKHDIFVHDLQLKVTARDFEGSVLEESRAVLYMVKLCVRLFGKEVDLPAWVTSLALAEGGQEESQEEQAGEKGAAAAGGASGKNETEGSSGGLYSCELNFEADAQTNFGRGMICPLKYGMMGLDALAAVDAMIAAQRMSFTGVCSYSKKSKCPARELLVSSEIHQVVEANIMRVGKNLISPVDGDVVMAAVAMGFTNVSVQLQKHAAKAAHSMSHLLLEESQKNMVVDAMQLLRNIQVQALGREVALAIRAGTSDDPRVVRRHIEVVLEPRLRAIRYLRDELLPTPLEQIWNHIDLWTLTLDPENIRIIRNTQGGDLVPLNASMQDIFLHDVRLHASPQDLSGAVLEQARSLLEVVKLAARLRGKAVDVPRWVTSLEHAAGLTAEAMACEFDTHQDHEVNFKRALFCPLKYGAMGMDALAAADAIKHTSLHD